MRALTYWTPVILILVILVTSPSLSTGTEIIHDCRADLTQEQIDAGIKLFDITAHYDDAFELGPKAIKRVEDCLRDCPRKQRSLVIKEVLLRLQFRELGEDCTSSDEKYKYILYDADYRTRDSTAYQVWQNELLDTGLIFCTPFKDLYCSPISKKCECRPGTDLSRFGECATSIGGFCCIPGVVTPKRNDYPRLFDAYNDRNFHRDYSVIRGTYCDGCTRGLNLFLNGMCAHEELRILDLDLDIYFDFPSQRLSFGDSCNLEHETQLFTTTEEEINNYTIRVQKLRALRDVDAKFCDNKRLLVCGSDGKCECKKPSIYNNETKFCTFKSPHQLCEEESKFEKMTPTLPGKVSQEILEGFEVARKRECPVGCDDVQFPDGTLVQPNAKFCFTCANERSNLVIRIGKNCDRYITNFLKGAPPPSLPIDIPEYDKQVELFVQFNEKATEFEGLFRLDDNSTCNYEAELDVARFIRRIKSVEVPGTIFTAEDYKDLMSSMDKYIIGNKMFCRRLRGFFQTERPNNRPVQLCSPATPTATSVCHKTNNTDYLKVLVKRLSGKSFEAPANPTCSPHPRDVIQYAEEQFPLSRPSDANPNFVTTGLSAKAYEYLFNRLENLFIQNAQFCNRTGGFKCSESVYDKTNVNGTGRCEFSQDVLDEVQTELEQIEADRKVDQMSERNVISKSSHKFIQHLLPTLLFILHIINLNF